MEIIQNEELNFPPENALSTRVFNQVNRLTWLTECFDSAVRNGGLTGHFYDFMERELLKIETSLLAIGNEMKSEELKK